MERVKLIGAAAVAVVVRGFDLVTGKADLQSRLELADRERDKALGLAGYWKGHAAVFQAVRDDLRTEQMYRHDSDQRALNLLDRALAKGLSSVHDEAHELLVQAGRRT